VNLHFEPARAAHLRGATQRARVLSEHWVATCLFCPACSQTPLRQYPNNQPTADFACARCGEDFELKAQRTAFGRRIVDGAYATMMRRLASERIPNLLLLNYAPGAGTVTNLELIPKHLFVASMIERRPALAPTARRAGWVGCKIVLGEVPSAGRIAIVRAGVPVGADAVQAAWRRLLFLRASRERGWLVRTMAEVERLPPSFTLAQLYAREAQFAAAFPANANVRAKLRQQLQVLRDRGWLRFLGDGVYERV
jgi:type II restriction enzyme